MPICSYVVQPVAGAATRLEQALNAMDGCEAKTADNHDILVLVTETDSPDEEKRLRETLQGMPDIACLTLAFGHVAAAPQEETTP